MIQSGIQLQRSEGVQQLRRSKAQRAVDRGQRPVRLTACWCSWGRIASPSPPARGLARAVSPPARSRAHPRRTEGSVTF